MKTSKIKKQEYSLADAIAHYERYAMESMFEFKPIRVRAGGVTIEKMTGDIFACEQCRKALRE